MPWNPAQYHKFNAERSAPFDDLLALVEIRPHIKVVDLGCGTGELTRRLADSLPSSDVLGLDNSPQMLERASAHAGNGLRFQLGDQSALSGDWDLILSNAALQWTEHHESLIPNLFSHLLPNGQIAVQIPSNHEHASHRIIREVAAREPFKSALNGWVRYAPVLPIEKYAEIFFRLGAEKINVFEKIYPHLLENSDAIVEWISGTALVPYFERIGNLRDEFVQVIRAEMKRAFPESPVFYPFKRTFFSAFSPLPPFPKSDRNTTVRLQRMTVVFGGGAKGGGGQ